MKAVFLNCAIIPQPKTIRSNTHSKFVINEQTCIQVATNKAKTEIHFLTDRLKQAASLTPEIKQFLVPKNNIIVFKELPKNTLGKEGYRLQVTEDSIEIEANEKNGFFMLSKRYYNFFRLKFTHQQLLLKEVGKCLQFS